MALLSSVKLYSVIVAHDGNIPAPANSRQFAVRELLPIGEIIYFIDSGNSTSWQLVDNHNLTGDLHFISW